MPEMKRKIGWFGKLLIVAAFLILTGALLWFNWVAGATNRRDAALERLRDAGIATNVEELLDQVRPVPLEINPAVAYEQAWSLIDGRDATWRAWDDFHPAGTEPTPEEEAERARLERAVVDKYQEPLRLITLTDSKIRPAVDRVRADFGVWSQRHGRIPPDMISTPDSSLYRLGDLTRLLHAEASVAAADGDADRVLMNAIRIIGMADAMDSDAHWLPDHSRSFAIRLWAANLIIDNADTAAKGTQRLRAEVIALLLDDGPSTAGFATAMAGEATMQQCAMRELEAGRLQFSNFVHAGRRWAQVPQEIYPRAILRDAAADMAAYTLAVRHAGRADRFPEAEAQMPEAWFARDVAFPDFFASTLLHPVLEAIKDEFHSRTDRRLAATTLAIRSYERDHAGQFPPDLEALVPEYLPRVPIDPMAADGDLMYDSQRGVLWSIGADSINGGGDGSSDSWHPNRWNARDAVIRLRSREALSGADSRGD